MVSPVPIESFDVIWPRAKESLLNFWNTTANFETIEALEDKIRKGRCQLWCYLGDTGVTIFFTTYIKVTTTAKILQGVHAGGVNLNELELAKIMPVMFKEVEVVAKQLGFDAVAINTRKGLVKFLHDYEFQSITLVKRI